MSPATTWLMSRLPLPLLPSPSPLREAWFQQKNREIFSPTGRSCKKCASGGGYAPPEVCGGGWGASVRRVCTWRPTESPRALSCAPSRRSCLGVRMQFSPPSGGCVCQCVCVCVADVAHLAPSKSAAPRATPTGRTRPQEFFPLSCFLACAVRRRISWRQLPVSVRRELSKKIARPVCCVLWITRRGPWNGLFLTVTTHRSR